MRRMATLVKRLTERWAGSDRSSRQKPPYCLLYVLVNNAISSYHIDEYDIILLLRNKELTGRDVEGNRLCPNRVNLPP